MKRERLERRRAWDRSIVLVSIAALFLASGCSFMFLDRPHDSYARYEKIACTTSYALPGLDTGLVALHVASIAALGSASGDAYGGQKKRDSLIQLDVSWMILEGASAIWGYYKVAQCNDLIAAQGSYVPRRTWRPPPRGIEPGIEPPAPPPAMAPPPIQPRPVAPAPAPTAPTPPAAPAPQKADDE